MSTSVGSTTMTQLTPTGRGAIATLAVEGPHAAAVVAHFFLPHAKSPPPTNPHRRIRYGAWVRDTASEDIILCQIAHDVVEIHCHGGVLAIEALKEDLRRQGVRDLPWEEWIVRHAATGIESEARRALSMASTDHTADILLTQLHGALAQHLNLIATTIESGEIDGATQLLEHLAATAQFGLHLVTPWRIVVAGPANVGKSSLINALLGFQRSLVHDQPGTTRDFVTASTSIEGWPVVLTDTAGVRVTDAPLESAGIDRTWSELRRADVIVLVVDPDQSTSVEYSQLRRATPEAITVLNKCDLPPSETLRLSQVTINFDLRTSAHTGEGIAALLQMLASRLVPISWTRAAPVLFTTRQLELVELAIRQLAESDGAAALRSLAILLAPMPGRAE